MKRIKTSNILYLLFGLASIQMVSTNVDAASESGRVADFNMECQAHVLMVTWELHPELIPQQAQTRKDAERQCKMFVDRVDEKKLWPLGSRYLGCFYGIQIALGDMPADKRSTITENLVKEHCK
jgi:hypothetical protein